MTYYIDIQNATNEPLPINEEILIKLASLTLKNEINQAELTIRIVYPEEMVYLNNTYRNQNKTTNVLAFPSVVPESIPLDCPFLGDVVICSQVLFDESKQLNKSLQEHWSLIVIHGVLHLLGYDHIEEHDTVIMQGLESQLLAELGYVNPYETEEYNLE